MQPGLESGHAMSDNKQVKCFTWPYIAEENSDII